MRIKPYNLCTIQTCIWFDQSGYEGVVGISYKYKVEKSVKLIHMLVMREQE